MSDKRLSSEMKRIIVSNWKSTGSLRVVSEFVHNLKSIPAQRFEHNELVVCPPSPLIYPLKSILENDGLSRIRVGAQDLWHLPGNFTGDTNVDTLSDCGAEVFICGHNERRLHHYESDAVVGQKAAAVLQSLRLTRPLHDIPSLQKPAQSRQLTTVFCVGDNFMARSMQGARDVITTQLEAIRDQCPPELELWQPSSGRLLIAYEPVWSFGTRDQVTLSHYREISKIIREWLSQRVHVSAPHLCVQFPVLCAGVRESHVIDCAAHNAPTADYFT